jgi:hypothetical protein
MLSIFAKPNQRNLLFIISIYSPPKALLDHQLQSRRKAHHQQPNPMSKVYLKKKRISLNISKMIRARGKFFCKKFLTDKAILMTRLSVQLPRLLRKNLRIQTIKTLRIHLICNDGRSLTLGKMQSPIEKDHARDICPLAKVKGNFSNPLFFCRFLSKQN